MKKIALSGLIGLVVMFNGCAEKNIVQEEIVLHETQTESSILLDEETAKKRQEPYLPKCPEKGLISKMVLNKESTKNIEEIKGCIQNVENGQRIDIFTKIKITKIENQ